MLVSQNENIVSIVGSGEISRLKLQGKFFSMSDFKICSELIGALLIIEAVKTEWLDCSKLGTQALLTF